ncbi:unnamed protein product [Triticum turgidum subsp. durum]|uniref:Glycerol-3-phosphate acyltransferase RAM2/GPAT1-8 HAD-like domain-containing protein n=1 Tax=Triticum turgidum subsp. durum TaxID=4567 RepID=A0A9R0TI74_TRITD|nr:unnamed protein product [Triticum turgidum subsp. durum]
MAGAHKFIFPNFLSLFFHGGCGAALPPPHPSDVLVHKRAPPSARLTDATALVVDVDGGLLLSSGSLFPYFMLVAIEAGGLLRGLLLLLLYPFIACIGGDVAIRAMAFVAFCGLRATRFRAGRAVLPRWLLENVGLEAFDAVRRRWSSGAAGRRAAVVWASRMPRVMVEPFLKDYLEADVADVVAAREMKVLWGLYTGLMEEGGGEAASEARKKIMEGAFGDDVVGFSGGSMEFLCNNTLSSSCKEVPLFAELSGDGVVPVALAVETAMFHGTTAGGWKSMDALYYLANPRMCYTVEFLGRVDTSPVRDGGAASTDVANRVQRLMAASLGYECTMLTRKDKYLMLAGNDGVVRAKGAACQWP